MNALGKAIGIVEHSFSTTIVDGDEVTIKIGIDYSNASDNDIRGWLTSNRVIALQRPLRPLSASEIKALNGTVIDATTCGQKIRSKQETFKLGIKALRAAGMNAEADELERKYNESKSN
jgi:hypothetical protein